MAPATAGHLAYDALPTGAQQEARSGVDEFTAALEAPIEVQGADHFG